LEHVRREVFLGPAFDATAFEDAFAAFRQLYHIKPSRVLCAPDVLQRYCALFERNMERAHGSGDIRLNGIPLVAAIIAPGTVAFEGEVDEERMGDW